MPNLVAIDVSVTDNRLSLVFSHRAVAAAYAAYLRALDLRPHQPIPNYRRAPHLHAAAKEVSLSLPDFITWFITCRLPDDEDSVTFTFLDDAEAQAARWAESMVLFERVPSAAADADDYAGAGAGGVKELHVRRLWNRERLVKRLEELRRRAAMPVTGVNGKRSRVASPTWGTANGNVNGMVSGNGAGNGSGRVPVPFAVPAGRGDIWW